MTPRFQSELSEYVQEMISRYGAAELERIDQEIVLSIPRPSVPPEEFCSRTRCVECGTKIQPGRPGRSCLACRSK